MNISTNRNNRLGLCALIALAITIISPAASAAMSADSERTVGPVKTQAEANEIKPDSTVMMVCGACKTVKLTQFQSRQANGRPPMAWMAVGSKHECEHCGGTITVVNGKTKDEMQHNCSKCGEGAAFCCVVEPEKK